MDGRVQLPVNTYLKNRFGVEYVDVITEAGPVGVLAANPESVVAQSIFKRVQISINAHASAGIAITAHHDCAGNPISDSQQKPQLQICHRILKERYPNIEVVGLWIDSNWTIQEY